MNNSITTSKKVYFEFMRVIACALVIFNHLPGYDLYSYSHGGLQFVYMCLTMITRINVPLFFLISGALLFKRDDDWLRVFRIRFIRIIVLLLVFDLILMSINKIISMKNGTEYDFSFSTFIHGFLENSLKGAGAHWYLYCYLGILLFLPFLQRISKGLTKTEVIVLLALHFVKSSLFPLINIFLVKSQLPTISLSSNFIVPFAFEKCFFYPLIGFYIENNIDVKKLKFKHLLCLFIVSIVGILISNICTYIDADLNGKYSQGYVQLFDYITTIAVFIFVKYLFVKAIPKLNEGIISKVICLIGSLTLGIYMLDPCFKIIFYGRYENWAEPYLPTIIVSFVWIIISMTLGGLITYVLKKIPGVKHIL